MTNKSEMSRFGKNDPIRYRFFLDRANSHVPATEALLIIDHEKFL
jgi:hypothetical protein